MPHLTRWLVEYRDQQHEAHAALPLAQVAGVVALLQRACGQGARIFGNGGGAANASHFATDLGKADHVLVIPDTHCGRVEDAQMTICYMLNYTFMEAADAAGGVS